ncbi:hypothetical protein PPERSA_12830 [Pseudocohnilembus persalinus]|uniref:Uncharacterized protein n=1 Tax=Pseudocohnilembus persalinus TaxID=266149 RepID=A0A0V0QEM0_PSEPJ|nr:hypothetical protein PPERSA_12830 [Pseudocohnilembus persalinus]|eukprot:KRX00611.1 hypothetical protein PPERSA_12830 [Pseudocohnilembus persalinus]
METNANSFIKQQEWEKQNDFEQELKHIYETDDDQQFKNNERCIHNIQQQIYTTEQNSHVTLSDSMSQTSIYDKKKESDQLIQQQGEKNQYIFVGQNVYSQQMRSHNQQNQTSFFNQQKQDNNPNLSINQNQNQNQSQIADEKEKQTKFQNDNKIQNLASLNNMKNGTQIISKNNNLIQNEVYEQNMINDKYMVKEDEENNNDFENIDHYHDNLMIQNVQIGNNEKNKEDQDSKDIKNDHKQYIKQSELFETKIQFETTVKQEMQYQEQNFSCQKHDQIYQKNEQINNSKQENSTQIQNLNNYQNSENQNSGINASHQKNGQEKITDQGNHKEIQIYQQQQILVNKNKMEDFSNDNKNLIQFQQDQHNDLINLSKDKIKKEVKSQNLKQEEANNCQMKKNSEYIRQNLDHLEDYVIKKIKKENIDVQNKAENINEQQINKNLQSDKYDPLYLRYFQQKQKNENQLQNVKPGQQNMRQLQIQDQKISEKTSQFQQTQINQQQINNNNQVNLQSYSEQQLTKNRAAMTTLNQQKINNYQQQTNLKNQLNDPDQELNIKFADFSYDDSNDKDSNKDNNNQGTYNKFDICQEENHINHQVFDHNNQQNPYKSNQIYETLKLNEQLNHPHINNINNVNNMEQRKQTSDLQTTCIINYECDQKKQKTNEIQQKAQQNDNKGKKDNQIQQKSEKNNDNSKNFLRNMIQFFVQQKKKKKLNLVYEKLVKKYFKYESKQEYYNQKNIQIKQEENKNQLDQIKLQNQSNLNQSQNQNICGKNLDDIKSDENIYNKGTKNIKDKSVLFYMNYEIFLKYYSDIYFNPNDLFKYKKMNKQFKKKLNIQYFQQIYQFPQVDSFQQLNYECVQCGENNQCDCQVIYQLHLLFCEVSFFMLFNYFEFYIYNQSNRLINGDTMTQGAISLLKYYVQYIKGILNPESYISIKAEKYAFYI